MRKNHDGGAAVMDDPTEEKRPPLTAAELCSVILVRYESGEYWLPEDLIEQLREVS